jgi:hypothetical protein
MSSAGLHREVGQVGNLRRVGNPPRKPESWPLTGGVRNAG